MISLKLKRFRRKIEVNAAQVGFLQAEIIPRKGSSHTTLVHIKVKKSLIIKFQVESY